MSTRWRHITAAVLLASYLLASAGATLHAVRECQGVADGGLVAMAPHDAHGGCEHHVCYREWLVASVARQANGAKRISAPVSDPRHHYDDCTVCRFQLIKKLVEVVSCAATLSDDCLEPIVLGVPLYRVAPLLATPESRAPPALA